MPTPLISVGMPTYNRPQRLARALNCICSQTYTHLEIIVSDNGSSDQGVHEVMEHFAQHDARIKLIFNQLNRGPGWNFENVFRLSTGVYFMWAADDDSWEADYIETLYNLMNINHNACLAFSDMDAINMDGSISSLYKPFNQSFSPYENPKTYCRLRSFVLQDPFLGKANLIYGLHRRSTLSASLKNYLYTSAWGSDMLLMSEVLSRGALILSKKKLFHKHHNSSDDQASVTIAPQANFLAVKYMYAYARLRHNIALLSIAISCRAMTTQDKFKLSLVILSQAWSWLHNDMS